ncbi:MAG: FAD-binding oxidoreductase [Lentisphaeria bacterium]|jgi:alkyldihydroxyacetonephosphate synthase|nr:FAD-binding oxidoreductase [Lentisphaeria bacterium]MDY0176423.1 FAD-binding oxidoreductase [Lentisphaeria bacterium]NLZ59469.1 FAD-binding oxidoreductase [Lentisphaerota bacterium]
MLLDRDSYMYQMIRCELLDAVGPQNVDTGYSDAAGHSIDYYWIPEMWHDRGMKMSLPDFVVYPGSAEEVSKVLKIANQYKIPVTPWGGGAGSQGGALPVYNGIILDTKRMNKVLRIDEQSLSVTCEAGIIAQQLEWAVNQAGYSTMHLPASISCSTMGGFLAHRGTGVLSTKWGKIEDMILSLEVVTPGGDIVQTLPVPRHASGPDLTMLFLGSEGTLGVITKLTMKIHPEPECRKFHAFIFKNLHEALNAGADLMRSRLRPAAIRLYDEEETSHHVKRVLGVDRQGSYLVFGFDGPEKIVDLEMEYALQIMSRYQTEDMGPEGGELWWQNKYKFFYPGYAFHMPQGYGTLDTVADFAHIEQVYTAMKKTVNENFPQARFIGHFSHWYEWGAMLYARFIFEKEQVPEDPVEALELYNRVWDLAIRAAIANGGVINEHHGVGMKLGRLMKELYKDGFKLLEGIKKTLDPNNIMNPGKMGFPGV